MLGFKHRWGSQTGEKTTWFWGRRGREDHAVLVEWGSRGGDTANGAGSLNHRLLLLFLRYGTPNWAREKEGLCASVGILKD